jgi:hypothetical protein
MCPDTDLSRFLITWISRYRPCSKKFDRRGEVTDLAELISIREVGRLRAFTLRMSVLSVRRNDLAVLRVTILTVGLASCGGEDPREVLLVAPLPWRSAKILGVDAAYEYREIAGLLPDAPDSDEPYPELYGAQFLLTWTKRSPEDQTIEGMGYREIETPDGFMYERTW